MNNILTSSKNNNQSYKQERYIKPQVELMPITQVQQMPLPQVQHMPINLPVNYDKDR